MSVFAAARSSQGFDLHADAESADQMVQNLITAVVLGLPKLFL
jgi:hypothetical protein